MAGAVTSPARAVVQLTVDELEQLVRAAVRDELRAARALQRPEAARRPPKPPAPPVTPEAHAEGVAALARARARRGRPGAR